ncbi:MAG: 5'-3' exonuclease [Herminiimonas sp.]|nr:5'-3' exonuclease [Herminiimonas sp.]
MSKFLAIDGMHIVRRIYEASPEQDGPEKAEAALRHSLVSLRRLLATHQPSHVLPAFDFGGPNWRHEMHCGYRENHAPMPRELHERLPDFYRELERSGLAVVSVPEVEAADVIATAVLRWIVEERGPAIIATNSKYLYALMGSGALIWDHFKSEWHGRDWVMAKYGVPPEWLPDLFALSGNAADGVPGVAKIGVKTAARLINGYGGLEQVMAGAGILKDTTGERLRQGAALAVLSRQLVAMKTDVRLGVTWKTLAWAG